MPEQPKIGDIVWFGQPEELSPGDLQVSPAAFRGFFPKGQSANMPPAMAIPAIVMKVHDSTNPDSELDIIAFCGIEPSQWRKNGVAYSPTLAIGAWSRRD